MAGPLAKRRKLEHGTSSADEDSASFASFGDEVESGTDEENYGLEDDELNDGELAEAEDDEVGEEEEDEEETDSWHDATETQMENANTLKESAQSSSTKQLSRPPKDAVGQIRTNGVYMPGAVKSNAFQIQIDDLLEQIRPKQGKREQGAEQALHKLKSTIESLSPRNPLPVDEAERKLLLSNKVVIPFPEPRPSKDAKYKLEYKRPTNINVVGSYALKTRPRMKEAVEIDMTVTMPPSLFQEKDFLNYRYSHKRAYFLACIAAGVQDRHRNEFQLHFRNLHENDIQPILVILPSQRKTGDSAKPSELNWKVNVIPCIGPDVFASAKLQPDRNCVRKTMNSSDDGSDAATVGVPTSFYNSTIRSDMLTNSYLKLMHSASKKCPAFVDACLLANTWLRQRGLGSDIHAGGFGRFEVDALMALLLESGVSNSRPILSEGYSSYQLWKATLQLLAVKDIAKEALVLGPLEGGLKPTANGSPIIWDASRDHNLLYKTTSWSYKWLKHEARMTLGMLNDQSSDSFESAFILRSHLPSYRYDNTMEIPASVLGANVAYTRSRPLENCVSLYDILSRALGERVTSFNILPRWSAEWDIGFARPSQTSDATVLIGFLVNAEAVDRTVEHGPSADNKTKAASFREFWGEKAELRRFKDGSIHESLVWSDSRHGQSILEQIVRHVIARHISNDAHSAIKWNGDGIKKLLSRSATEQGSESLSEAFKQLENDIRSLSELPLSLRHITPADAQLRCSAVVSGKSPHANVVIQFEGSARWPDDLVAIQRTRLAFLLNLSRLLQNSNGEIAARVGLENEEHDILNQAFLDVVYESGAAFRLRIHHDREQALLEKRLKDKVLDPRLKEEAALGLAKYKRDYIKTPAFTQSIARLCSRHTVMSGTIRLLKKWLASHVLTNHFADEIVELFVARTFTQPWPWSTPSSISTAFLRTLLWLSRWDWRKEPLIVDLSGSGELKQADYQTINTRFEAWRKLDPLLNRVVLFCASNVDPEGTAWTDGRPQKVVAARLTALAKAACAEVEANPLYFDPASLFSSALGDYDFVIHLQPALVRGRSHRRQRGANGASFKNLEIQADADPIMRGYDPVQDFLRDLELAFGSAVVFFSGGTERPVIAGLWDPSTSVRTWKLNLGYSTIPRHGQEKETVVAELNKDAILADIAQLGGDMVEKIDLHR